MQLNLSKEVREGAMPNLGKEKCQARELKLYKQQESQRESGQSEMETGGG